MKGEDKDRIESRTKALGEASAKMAERLYAQSGAQGGAGETGTGEAHHETGGGGGAKDDVVDAEFEEVKDDKK